ncbi:hypothetical protein BCR44DRAFT_45918 [Catenaria anguillulae PL171]|uniref:JmjC domain-containing protein n=1 Tax=Catenaria anguillulae PL171 TaxID=765915 RepID=A0A1Y2H5H5_9FUNG|nr:hypothetical protein BCR44DRAFT_45918 [Catenaria anguillulae PL171]
MTSANANAINCKNNHHKNKRSRTLPPAPPTPPHPLGIRPLGNLLFARTAPGFVDTRTRGLGPTTFARFDDEFVLAFLVQYVNDPVTLCRLAQASKAWLAFWSYDEIWKAWVLEKWRTLPVDACRRFVPPSWRHTYISLAGAQDKANPDEFNITIPHFYSDLLFQPHIYTSTPLSYLLDMCQAYTNAGILAQLPRVSNPSPMDFATTYESTSTPCILTDCISHWPAFATYPTFAEFESLYGSLRLRAEATDLTLSEYLTYLRANPPDESPVYLFDKDFPRQGALGAQLARSYSVPDYFKADLFSVLGATRPDFAWLIVGPIRSGSTHHKDPNMTSAWNAVITGSKLWIMYPPDVVPPGVFPSADGAQVSTPNSLVDWWLNWMPRTRDLGLKGGVWGVCGKGEVMFVPHGWWHTVINLEDSIAFTQNYVSVSNLRAVLEFLRTSRGMVSGYGNADDAQMVESAETSATAAAAGMCCGVDAGRLYENFVAGLKEHKAQDEEVMSIVTEFERDVEEKERVRKSAVVVEKEGKIGGTLWDTIVGDEREQGGAVFSLFG